MPTIDQMEPLRDQVATNRNVAKVGYLINRLKATPGVSDSEQKALDHAYRQLMQSASRASQGLPRGTDAHPAPSHGGISLDESDGWGTFRKSLQVEIDSGPSAVSLPDVFVRTYSWLETMDQSQGFSAHFFRGQCDESWGLVPTRARAGAESEDQLHEDELNELAAFQK